MDLTLTTEQLAMAEAVRDLVAKWAENPPSHDERWATVSEIGLDVAGTAEEAGGLGLGLSDLLPSLRALGPAAADWPWAATLVAGPAVAQALGAGPADASGTPIGVAVMPRPGRAPVRVRHADRLRRIALISDGEAALVPAAGWQPVAHGDLLDEPTWTAAPDDAVAQLRPLPSACHALAAGRVAEATVLLGAGERALALAVDYAKTRQQFGKPIGAFQAVKHLLAQARTELAFVEPLIVGAAIAVDRRAPLAGRDAAIALAAAGSAAQRSVRTSIQVHGGIGYTEELPLGRLLAAATHGVQAWGGEARLNDEIDSALAIASEHVGGLPADRCELK